MFLVFFLCDNLDIFVWKHEDMVGIDPKVSYHHLKIDSKSTYLTLFLLKYILGIEEYA